MGLKSDYFDLGISEYLSNAKKTIKGSKERRAEKRRKEELECHEDFGEDSFYGFKIKNGKYIVETREQLKSDIYKSFKDVFKFKKSKKLKRELKEEKRLKRQETLDKRNKLREMKKQLKVEKELLEEINETYDDMLKNEYPEFYDYGKRCKKFMKKNCKGLGLLESLRKLNSYEDRIEEEMGKRERRLLAAETLIKMGISPEYAFTKDMRGTIKYYGRNRIRGEYEDFINENIKDTEILKDTKNLIRKSSKDIFDSFTENNYSARMKEAKEKNDKVATAEIVHDMYKELIFGFVKNSGFNDNFVSNVINTAKTGDEAIEMVMNSRIIDNTPYENEEEFLADMCNKRDNISKEEFVKEVEDLKLKSTEDTAHVWANSYYNPNGSLYNN